MDYSDIRARFEQLDRDGSGTISASEMRYALRGYASDQEVARHIALMDIDEDGEVSWGEFLKRMLAHEGESEEG